MGVSNHMHERGEQGLGHRLAGVLAQDPAVVVAADGVGEGRELGGDAAGAADEGDQGGEFAERSGVAIQPGKAGLGLPEVPNAVWTRIALSSSRGPH